MAQATNCARGSEPRLGWVISLGALVAWLALAAAGADAARAASAGAVEAGAFHTCALTTGGGVLCWGYNFLGQLGDGTTTNRNVPVAVSGLGSGVAAIATANNHSCALTTGGGVLCWGYNVSGQLGDGTTTSSNVPVAVSGLGSGVAAIAAGRYHTCALTTGGGVLCWGYNYNGQLGDGTTTNRNVPVAVSGLGSGVAAIAGGFRHSCALTTGGGVLCWGDNASGQLGDGTTTSSNVPVAVSGLGSGLAAIATGDVHTCALTAGGGVLCWGDNASGQLGDGTTTSSNVPVAVSGLGSGLAAIAGGYRHTCALTAGGGVLCWGDNASGQLGDGTTTSSNVPVAVIDLGSGVAAIAAGQSHTCALTTGGGVLCWGRNSHGQLGDGTAGHSLFPLAVIDLGSGVAAIAAGGDHSCALTTGGGVLCWGRNAYGQLGDGTTADSSVPLAVSGLGSGVAAIAGGYRHTCALTTGGGVLCWGYNAYGQLGDGTTTSSNVPVAVSGLGSGVAAIAPGDSHTCALTTGGGVLCWGYNYSGQLGDGTTFNRNFPLAVSGLESGGAAIAVGRFHSCALTTGGGALCWGTNYEGQLGDGTFTGSSVPVAVSGLGSGVAAIAAGADHTCALTAGGGILCWGFNVDGQLGDGTFTGSSVPVAVSGLGSGVAAIAAGGSHTCALTTGGGILCWGYNAVGQLGDGTFTGSSVPVAASGLGSGVAAIAAGGSHTCALTTGGGVLCWGSDAYGQLGDGHEEIVETPRPVVGFGGAGPAAVPALGLPALGLLVVALMLAGASRRWSRPVRNGIARSIHGDVLKGSISSRLSCSED